MTAYQGPPFGWVIPEGYRFSNAAKCASCHADIAWCETPKGNRAPLDPDGKSHFTTCPNAADHRRPKAPKESPA